MIHFIAGGKGEGKTKRMIAMANAQLGTTDGHLVFIDDDKRHIFDLHYNIRFVMAGSDLLQSHAEFIGFIMGILSQNNDIKTIYIDGLTNILSDTLTNDDLDDFATRLQSCSEQNDVDFVVCINRKKEDLPPSIHALLI